MAKVTLTSPAKIRGKVRKVGWSGDVSEEVLADLIRLSVISKLDEVEETTPELTPAERAEKVATAVKLAVEADPTRERQPIIANIETLSGLDGIKSAEITFAFEALQNKE